MLTIGQFARESGLTAKALRLYDRVGLLAPAAVDSESGYRFYEVSQLRAARLIAALRGIDVPLAEVRVICALPAGAVAAAVGAYWRRVSAGNADRDRQVALLVSQLSGREDVMETTVAVRYAVACEVGGVRETNQDCAFADDFLFAVADGGGLGGALASEAAVSALRGLDSASSPPAELLGQLTDKINTIHSYVRSLGAPDAAAFTTLTALVRSGSRLALVHVGDTRAYLVRGGELTQLTQDHTWIQGQVDSGRIGADEVAGHPRRALLVRAIGVGGEEVEADLALRTVVPGDRYLLCSDGLSAVVSRVDLHGVLAGGGSAAEAAARLVALAESAGAPDNIACVVADFVSA